MVGGGTPSCRLTGQGEPSNFQNNMNAYRISKLIEERNNYRRECYAMRVWCGILFAACLIVIGTTWPVVLATLAVLVLSIAALTGCLMWATNRGNQEIGVGESQGR